MKLSSNISSRHVCSCPGTPQHSHLQHNTYSDFRAGISACPLKMCGDHTRCLMRLMVQRYTLHVCRRDQPCLCVNTEPSRFIHTHESHQGAGTKATSSRGQRFADCHTPWCLVFLQHLRPFLAVSFHPSPMTVSEPWPVCACGPVPYSPHLTILPLLPQPRLLAPHHARPQTTAPGLCLARWGRACGAEQDCQAVCFV
jgi:hypothetical protein